MSIDKVVEGPKQTGTAANVESPALPEKYEGKTPVEIAEMHQNAEKRLGEMRNEIGQLRQYVSEQIQSQQTQAQAPEQEVDFWSDPMGAIRQQVQSQMQPIQEQLQQAQQAQVRAKLAVEHPDWQQIAQDQKFAEWVVQTPERKRQFERADSGVDYDAANELLTNYKAMTGTEQQIQNEVKREHMVRAAITEEGSPHLSTQKIYSRLDLQRLKNEDPTKYSDPAFQEELARAYQEGRVR